MIFAYQNRSVTKDITIYDVNGVVITPGPSDKIRAIITRSDLAEPVLIVASDAPTALKSSVTLGAKQRLRLDAKDLLFTPGIYTLLIDYYDAEDQTDEDNTAWKSVWREVFVLQDTPAEEAVG